MKNQWIQASKYLWRTLIHEFEETNNTHPHTHTKFAKLKSFFFFFVDNMQNPILKKVMLCTIIRTNPVAKEHKIYNKKLKKKKKPDLYEYKFKTVNQENPHEIIIAIINKRN